MDIKNKNQLSLVINDHNLILKKSIVHAYMPQVHYTKN